MFFEIFIADNSIYLLCTGCSWTHRVGHSTYLHQLEELKEAHICS